MIEPTDPTILEQCGTSREAGPAPLSRRHAIIALGAAGLTAALAHGPASGATSAQDATPDADSAEDESPAADAAGDMATPQPIDAATPVPARDILGVSRMPDWRFSGVNRRDPYEGTLTKPEGVPAGIRVAAFEVSLSNRSDQPLEFSISDVRLRDDDGVEYRAGEYLGTEPRLVSQNLPNGEITRGWVWFGLPENSTLASIVFIAPPPVLRVSL